METELYWRNHPILQYIQEQMKTNLSGELSSLRFTWMRPKKLASEEDLFLYSTFAVALDGAQWLAGSELKILEIEKVPGMNILFGLASFTNGITAEFEFNESLPNSMPDICFLKANFSHGHITNQPVVGYFNEEGMVLASDDKLERLIAESGQPLTNSPIEQMRLRCRVAGMRGDLSALVKKIREVVR